MPYGNDRYFKDLHDLDMSYSFHSDQVRTISVIRNFLCYWNIQHVQWNSKFSTIHLIMNQQSLLILLPDVGNKGQNNSNIIFCEHLTELPLHKKKFTFWSWYRYCLLKNINLITNLLFHHFHKRSIYLHDIVSCTFKHLFTSTSIGTKMPSNKLQ